MPTVRFTDNIQRHVNCPTRVVDGARVRDVLDAYFQANAQTRGYVLDEQGRLREHMAIFVNGGQLRDRAGLTDLVYRHALDVDDTGEVLAFGSTTGSLRVSDDGGDAWQAVSSNLPPIHSVRLVQGA
jgi:sulfur-carrier protein